MNEHVQTATSAPLFNPLAPEFIRNPYPYYERMRATDPVHLTEHGMYVASRHADITVVLRDKRFGKEYADRIEPALRPQHHEGAGVSQFRADDAAAGSARPHPLARAGGEGLHRAPGRGHASAHPADRRRELSIASSRRARWT